MRNELRNMSAESLEQLENELRDEASTPEDVFEALERNEKGFVKQSIGNCVFALSHDPLLNGNIRRNELTCQTDISGDMPWNRRGVSLTDTDINNIRLYLESNYKLTAKNNIESAIDIVANENRFHPIRDVLNSLTWDGTPRIATALHRFLGAAQNDYTAEVMRLHMLAAISRVFDPGCKYDIALCLIGPQGGGKSSFFRFLALVFHRFLGDENPKNRLSIYFNGEAVTGIDPFLTKHPATQPLSEQILRIGTDEIRVKPYVLPYLNKMSKKDLDTIGGKDELRQQQGFYIYRSKRLIIWGTWFRLIKQNELGKLARVRVDIPNSLDSIWEIDIKKSTASLPHFIKKNLADIVENTVGRSERVYKYRGRNVQTDNLIHIWNPIDDRGKLQYQVNRELPVLQMLEKHVDDEGSALLESFIKMMENAFPYADVYYRMAKSEANVTESALENNDVYAIADQMVQQVEAMGGDVAAFIKTMDMMDFFIKYPDVVRQIKEVYDND